MASSLSRPVTNRAIHLRISPRPSNLAESREILRLLSQFGPVEYFRHLKHDTLTAPNTALVIFREEAPARECLRRSPIRFRMGRVGRTTTASTNHDGEVELHEDNSRLFQLSTNPSRASFRDQLDASHFHGSFAVDSHSIAQQDLAKKVPVKGLSDVEWRAKEKPWFVVNQEREGSAGYRGSGGRRGLGEIWQEAHGT